MLLGDAGACQRELLRCRRVGTSGQYVVATERAEPLLGGFLGWWREPYRRAVVYDCVGIPLGAFASRTDHDGLLSPSLLAHRAALRLLPAALYVPTPGVGRHDLGAVDARPAHAAFQLPIDGRTLVVYVSAHQPLSHHPCGVALAAAGIGARRTSVPLHLPLLHADALAPSLRLA